MVDPQPVPDPAVRVIHLVAKTHLDLGFTALASEVEQQYLDDFFPRAIAVAGELRRRGGPERLTWTTGSWILHRALLQADAERAAAAVDAAVRAGHLAWHALPLTTHTELMDAPLFRAGLGISQELDARFGRTTTAAKMTDVPGHTRAMVPLLAEAGVTFLHLGVNPAWPVPDVPRVFRWRSPDGAGGAAEVTVAYQAGGYGGDLVIPGGDEALAFLHSGDNLGPPSVDDVIAAHADLRSRYPGAEVRASTLDAFARALAASGAVDELPVITAEIGDPWLFGAGSDPQKVAAYRELLAFRSTPPLGPLEPAGAMAIDRALLQVAEHTWGLDQKIALPDDTRWGNDRLSEVRSSAPGRRFEESWAEQRAYVDRAWDEFWLLVTPLPMQVPTGSAIGTITARSLDVHAAWSAHNGTIRSAPGVREIGSGRERVSLGQWEVALDPDSGGLTYAVDGDSGRQIASTDHPLGVLMHQSFDQADYEAFYEGLSPTAEDEWWARWDNTKPGIDSHGARSARWAPHLLGAWLIDQPTSSAPRLVAQLGFVAEAVDLGAPREILVEWRAGIEGRSLTFRVLWVDKPATRLPEATWCSFNPIVAEPERWGLDKMGQRVSPLDVVRRGGRSLHAVGEGMHYDGPDGRLTITTPDAPLVAPGAPNLLDADPPVPDLAGGFHVLLHDNCWGTNFPMWNEGPARFRFELVVD